MVLLIDNYDSFVFNLARYFQRLGHETLVVRNDAIDSAAVRKLKPGAIVLSPGPCAPAQAGCSLDLVRDLHRELPILGVCLGHQAIAEAFGGRVVRSGRPVHGRSSPVYHDGRGLFSGLPNPLSCGRYHSLIVDQSSLPASLEVTARTLDHTVMAIQHRELPVAGVQFHPESVLTRGGYAMLASFLALAGMASSPPVESSELDEPLPQAAFPSEPITF